MTFFNSELEKTIIGNLMLDSELNELEITENDFYYDQIRSIYKTICECKSKNMPLEMILIELSNNMTDLELISSCTTCGVVTANYKHNCEMLIRLSSARQLHNLGIELKKTDYSQLEAITKYAKTVINSIENTVAFDDLKVIDMDKTEFCPEFSSNGFVPTGIETVDECLNDLEPKRTTLITGPSHHGKTTVVRQIMANAIEKNNKVLWIMGENETQDEIRRLYTIVIGRKKGMYDLRKDNKKYVKIPNEKATKALSKWHKGKLRILHKSEAKLKNQDEMFAILEKELMNHKHNLVVVDNLMSVLSAKSFEKNEAQGDFMQKCCDLSKVYNTHIILVLHPRKNSDIKQCNNDDISGSSDIPNKADNIIWVTKSSEEEKSEGIDGWVAVKKNKKWGVTVRVPMQFDTETETLAEIKDSKVIVNTYNIEKFIEKEIKFYNGNTQTVQGVGYVSDEEPF